MPNLLYQGSANIPRISIEYIISVEIRSKLCLKEHNHVFAHAPEFDF